MPITGFLQKCSYCERLVNFRTSAIERAQVKELPFVLEVNCPSCEHPSRFVVEAPLIVTIEEAAKHPTVIHEDKKS